MSFKPTERELKITIGKLRHYDILYRRGRPAISDEQYDAIFTMLQHWERDWPELVTPDSPTQVVETDETKHTGWAG